VQHSKARKARAAVTLTYVKLRIALPIERGTLSSEAVARIGRCPTTQSRPALPRDQGSPSVLRKGGGGPDQESDPCGT
jgi:hypothetical protein